MKNEQLHSYLCATGISYCLGLGAIGSMATGLTLPVKPGALVILFLLLAAVISGLAYLRHGSLIPLGFGGILLLNVDLWKELKTLAAAVATRLWLGYGIPTPELLQGEQSKQVLTALSLIGGLIMVATAWAVQKKKTALPAVLLSLLPLGCCITVTDTVPDSAWLFLWGLGLVLLLMTQGIRHESPRQANKLTAALLIPTVLVLLLLFRMVPRNAPEQWSIAHLPQQIFRYFTGSSGPGTTVAPPEVDLSALQKRQQRQTPIMDVTADFTGTLYLRSRDYDEYTGSGWHITPGRTEEIYGFSPEFYQKDGTVEIRTRQPRDYYFLPAMTQQVQQITDGQAPNPAEETTYRFEHCALRNDWQTNWTHSGNSRVDARYLQLPATTYWRAQAYLGSRSPFNQNVQYTFPAPDTAQIIRQWLRQHVPYDLDTPNMPQSETDLAMWFLNDATSGYCVHYATAAVVLLRAAGVPARYVEGYTIAVQKGKTVTVRELHAHAWAEYYVNDVGWLVLEATPGGGTAPEEPVTTPPTQTQPVATTSPTVTTAPSDDPTVPPTESPRPDRGPGQTVRTPPTWLKPLLIGFVCFLAAAVLLWVQYQLRRWFFYHATHRGSLNRRALVIHRRLCRLSKWTKQPVPPELTQLAQKARFSNHTLTQPELSRLRGHLKLTEATLSLLPLPKRLLAKWLFARC